METETYKKIGYTFFGIFYVLAALCIFSPIFFTSIVTKQENNFLTVVWVTIAMFAVGLFFLILHKIKVKRELAKNSNSGTGTGKANPL